MLIYKWTNKINNKVYIGRTTRTIWRRLKGYHRDVISYARGTYKRSHPIVFALHKYGFDKFNLDIIDFTDNYEELLNKEEFWIDFYDARNKMIGYNVKPGGLKDWSGMKHTQATKDKISRKRIDQKAWAGSNNPKSKLTDQQKAEIVSLFTTVKDTGAIAVRYGVDRSSINRVLKAAGTPSPGWLGRKHKPESKQKMSITKQYHY